MSTNQETRGFQSEVKQLLQLMIHSLYSNKEIFLRELISNASDAADKLRFKALSNPALYEGDGELRVRVSFDETLGTLTISDNGIGMNREQVIDHLGTIAKSGTKEFLNSLGTDQAKDSQLIGQFGVGFYSAFIVADKVTVKTRAAGETQAVLWESAGEGDYTVADIEKATRGTDVILHLREEEKEFLSEWRLREIIGKYSDHIGLPVEIQTTEYNEEGKASGQKWEKINKAQALWTRSKNEISDEEYQEFYKHLSHDYNDSLIWAHNKVEGKQEYTSLLYVPAKAPWDLFNRDQKHGLKLYVQRVFIMDDAEVFMPNYLRFMRGLLDTNDLPLNVSREILQENKITASLRAALTKRALQLLEKLAKDDQAKYQTFWNEFGLVLKEGVGEDFANKQQIASLFRFASTQTDSSEQTVSLADYVGRMKEGQKAIYFLTADSYVAAKNSPHLELFNKKGIEVLLLSDRIDEWVVGHLTEFDGKPLQSITKSDLDLGDLADKEQEESQKAQQAEFGSFLERAQSYFGERVKKVVLTHRLTDTPAVVSTDNDEMTTQMAKLFAAMGQKAPEVKYTFELNPDHRMVKKIADLTDETKFNDWIELLFEQALLAERGSLENPAAFIKRMNKLLG
ncbi:heat shock protein 90 [Actinobacillus pleuropneumoniae]|uniref:Chaperone protein HtpG n=1 Tax=Actinobacillus pleuropneumoniae serotype 5b (strain L20) TaxID=416269 RepID=HTPG_ACTP2|nr:molecular chaperone HtpG [Actinobacillus pleuropneumoniae]A3N0Z5.1 RecName: Full=Chaperone protein HtpG; AltName: Full=Heat shock protein HtpG; AltName: Full=High temperature protein G [Actinobacillus pleuropneumoniae serovar 5b str. L20]ABN74081.1 chaperone protein HtpG [Actinobacillus pleuropneumoniae serovar 5b str. L20]MEE3682769.1 molecular chaperone HtpG [Actinobacillus pleuropneumoniae]QSZ39023.1 heat shock protein 90 [Actinobacillus pleuropneumoniae]UKH10800.1 molecular chaperone Ht